MHTSFIIDGQSVCKQEIRIIDLVDMPKQSIINMIEDEEKYIKECKEAAMFYDIVYLKRLKFVLNEYHSG